MSTNFTPMMADALANGLYVPLLRQLHPGRITDQDAHSFSVIVFALGQLDITPQMLHNACKAIIQDYIPIDQRGE